MAILVALISFILIIIGEMRVRVSCPTNWPTEPSSMSRPVTGESRFSLPGGLTRMDNAGKRKGSALSVEKTYLLGIDLEGVHVNLLDEGINPGADRIIEIGAVLWEVEKNVWDCPGTTGRKAQV